MILGSGLIQSAWPKASDWLIKDEFTDTVAAGSVNGTAATPGPGTRTVTDTENKLSVGSGVAAFAGGKASPAYGNPGIWYGAQARAAGVALLIRATITSNLNLEFGWDSDTATEALQGVLWSSGFRFFNAGTINVTGTNDVVLGDTIVVALILRTSGTIAAIYKSGQWQIKWVEALTSGASLYPALSNYNSTPSVDYLRVIQLPAPFNGDDGVATDVLSGSVSAGTTFTHEADCLIEATITTVPSADNIDIVFRQQDASNYWICRIATGGDISLQEVVAGSPTQRGVAAGVVSNGHRVVVIAEGTTVRIFSNNTSRITYSSASSSATATAGEVNTLGTGGVISNVKTWPRTLSGIAASVLNKASA